MITYINKMRIPYNLLNNNSIISLKLTTPHESGDIISYKNNNYLIIDNHFTEEKQYQVGDYVSLVNINDIDYFISHQINLDKKFKLCNIIKIGTIMLNDMTLIKYYVKH